MEEKGLQYESKKVEFSKSKCALRHSHHSFTGEQYCVLQPLIDVRWRTRVLGQFGAFSELAGPYFCIRRFLKL